MNRRHMTQIIKRELSEQIDDVEIEQMIGIAELEPIKPIKQPSKLAKH